GPGPGAGFLVGTAPRGLQWRQRFAPEPNPSAGLRTAPPVPARAAPPEGLPAAPTADPTRQRAPTMHGKMDCSGLTDPGRVREDNDDQYLIASLSKSMQVHQTSLDLDEQTRLFGASQGKLLLVADGVGGSAGGRRASTLAVNSLTTYLLNTMDWFFRLRADREDQLLGDLKAALEYCQERIRAEAERFPERRGMGTTLTM